jgi:hypothetical protein
MDGLHIGTNRLRGLLLAAVTLLSQALLARLTASLAANVLALILLIPWTVLLLAFPHPTLRQTVVAAAATVGMLLVFAVVVLAAGSGDGEAGEPTFISVAGEEGDPRFEVTGPELKISGVSAEVWEDTILAVCTTRAGAYTEEHLFAFEDIGNVASAQAEWPPGDQSLTLFFTEPLEAPPASCFLEGEGGDIGGAVFCDTGDETPLPPEEGGKSPFLVDEACAEARA